MKTFEPAAAGRLYVVGTPIGNLGDLSPRALEILAGADQVAAEDTRVSGRMLGHFDVHTPLISFHEHNTRMRLPQLLEALTNGRRIALVTDAGMPCISDPGAALVQACRTQGIPVEMVPGPSAVVTALAGSGMDCAHFYFEGFLPPKGQLRRQRLAALGRLTETAVVLYEAPHRLVRTLTDCAAQGWGARAVCLARELTKRYETFACMTVDESLIYFESHEPRGEYVLILAAVPDPGTSRMPSAAGPPCTACVSPPEKDGAATESAAVLSGDAPPAGALTAEQTAVAWAVLQLTAGQRVKDVAKALKNRFGNGGFPPNGDYYEWVVSLKAYCAAAGDTAGDGMDDGIINT